MVEYTTHPSASQLGDASLARPLTSGPTSIERALHQHEGLIHAIIRREGSGSLTCEEALQAGRIGLWRAILNYDPARGTAFSTYAWVAIRRHIHRAATQAAGDSGCQLVPCPHGSAEPSSRGLAEPRVAISLCLAPARLRKRASGGAIAPSPIVPTLAITAPLSTPKPASSSTPATTSTLGTTPIHQPRRRTTNLHEAERSMATTAMPAKCWTMN